jgi:hypothetical protein
MRLNIFRRMRHREERDSHQERPNEGLVRLGRTSKLLRGDYGQKDDNMRRYQD